MYHTHTHDLQLLQGMYGPLIVLNPGERFDPETDKIFLISEGGQGVFMPKVLLTRNSFGKSKWLLNGTDKPAEIYLKKGQLYRFRIINIGTQSSPPSVSITLDDQPVNWRLLARDGITLAKHQQLVVPATEQPTDIGETDDFEFSPAKAGNYKLDIFRGKTIYLTQIMKVEE